MRALIAVVTPLGRLIAVCSVLVWVLGALLGWVEMVLIAVTGLVTFALSCLLTIGTAAVRVQVSLSKRRVVAGGSSSCRVQVEQAGRNRFLPYALEVPVGTGVETFDVIGKQGHDHTFPITTERRGVIVVGPATTVRGDPLGLLRRTVVLREPEELFVHPVTTALRSFGTGLLRDLEGRTTNDMSMSDLAFHALREYAPGDDRRYIHWRSSAKASTVDSKFLVRQFLDTRRAHFAIVVDGSPVAFPDAEDFEIAVSAGASIAVRAALDDIDTTVVAAGQVAHKQGKHRLLDSFSRASFGPVALPELTARAAGVSSGATLAILITGAVPSFSDLRRAAAAFAPEVPKVVLRVDPSAATALKPSTALTVLTLRQLSDLPALLAGGAPR
ncbi:DUF58 domain-containing protein [Lentzea tibetensis]|uniref:DUF58 domain-containing protein n=1 Tax=Lentzea tibetensis TaxID=2591470 RepID=A0A563F257_9PSEU|nr:DUF58 domain-containing protein [Lentzea tibetensis]TWP54057.1 DUF58 domain-containing protein [Lentzea tibetensis]